MQSRNYLKVGLLAIGLFICAAAGNAEARERQPYEPRTERGAAAGQIVRKWAGYVHRVYRAPPMAWAKSMQATFAQADVRNLQRAVRMETYQGMMGVLLGQKTDDAQVIDVLARARGSSMQVLAAGNPAEDLVYTMMSPCRILDTRSTGTRIGAGETRPVQVSGRDFSHQGGQTCNSEIPADPSAVAINVVAVAPGSDGFLSVYPYGTTRGASSLNYARGGIVANELIAKATLGQPHDISVFSQADVDLVVDIVGYFMAPKAVDLECVLQIRRSDFPYGSGGDRPVSCLSGYVATGGTCFWSSTDPLLTAKSKGFTASNADGRLRPDGYSCSFLSEAAGTHTSNTQVHCCRIGGR